MKTLFISPTKTIIMRKSIFPIFTGLLIFQFVFNLESKAQVTEKPLTKLYLELATGPTTDNGAFGGLGLQGMLKNNWVATVSYQQLDINPKNLPSDYEQGYTVIILPFPDEMPATTMNIISFTGGKRIGSGRKTWFTTEAGISVISGDEFSFTKQPVEHYDLYTTSNYNVKKEAKTTIGAMLKADFTWAFTPYVGLGAGAFVNVSSLQTPVGGQIKLMVGWLNTKKKKVQ
jgi:hypothetical protein